MNWCDLLPEPPDPVLVGKGRHLSPQEQRIINDNQQSLIGAANQEQIQRVKAGLVVYRPMGGGWFAYERR